MIIEKLSSLTVKVSLTVNELHAYDLSFECLENNSQNTRALIAYIIHEIRVNLGLNLYSEHLYIEAFSCVNNGCILYISAVDNSLSDKAEENGMTSGIVMLESGTEKNMIRFSVDFDRYFHEYGIDSRLYYSDNIFRLIIHVDPEKFDSVIDTAFTHGLKYCTDESVTAYTQEYFTCIFDESAIEKLSGKKSF